MNFPKYKVLKWNIAECKTCKRIIAESYTKYCLGRQHIVVPRPNAPIMIEDLTFKSYSKTYSGTARAQLYSPKLDVNLSMSMGDWEKVTPLLELGVLRKKCWFGFTRKSSELGITFLAELDDNN